jgi:hypothetical protein
LSASIRAVSIFYENDFKTLPAVLLLGKRMKNSGKQIEPAVKIDDAGYSDTIPCRRHGTIPRQIEGKQLIEPLEQEPSHGTYIPHPTIIAQASPTIKRGKSLSSDSVGSPPLPD